MIIEVNRINLDNNVVIELCYKRGYKVYIERQNYTEIYSKLTTRRPVCHILKLFKEDLSYFKQYILDQKKFIAHTINNTQGLIIPSPIIPEFPWQLDIAATRNSLSYVTIRVDFVSIDERHIINQSASRDILIRNNLEIITEWMIESAFGQYDTLITKRTESLLEKMIVGITASFEIPEIPIYY